MTTTPPSGPLLAVGLMSGTSLDGITAALVRIAEPTAEDFKVSLLAHRTLPFGAERQMRITSAIARGSARELALLDMELGEWFAEAALAVLGDARVTAAKVAFIGSHGQTIWHEPRRASLQLGSPAVIAERTGIAVVADFRSRDVAAGGEGAPLVPRADRLLFAREDGPRVLLNIGGIANLTLVPKRGDPAPVVAFDTGPGVMVMDECVRRLYPGRRYDEDGAIAAAGHAVEKAVAEVLRHPFFEKDPPKSTGRELFGEGFTSQLIARCMEETAAPEDVVATATAITARAIGDAAARFLSGPHVPLDVVRSGGGAKNPALVAELERAWPGVQHRAFDDLYFDGGAKEAVAFAFLGYLTWTRRAGNEPGATGAAGPRVLGSITPA
jgi:anhydro-N-acetylmuramic acid kinase